MPQFRLLTAEESGVEHAKSLVAFHGELIRQGIDRELAESIALKVAGAASSNQDGHCGDIARVPGQELTNPVPFGNPGR